MRTQERCRHLVHHNAGQRGRSQEQVTAGNIILGGVVGIGVDAASGAMNHYPKEVKITLLPIGAPPPPAPNAAAPDVPAQPGTPAKPVG